MSFVCLMKFKHRKTCAGPVTLKGLTMFRKVFRCHVLLVFASMFVQVWSDLPRLHPQLYEYNDVFQGNFINPNLRKVVKNLKATSTTPDKFVDESPVWELVTESHVKDVFYIGKAEETRFGLFTKEFCRLFLEEIEHLSENGILLRNDKGMNQYGDILGKYW